MFSLTIHVKRYSSVKISPVSIRHRNPVAFYYLLPFTVFGSPNLLSVGAPDSRPHVLCKEVGSRLVAVAPALGAPLPAIILPVTQARCCSGRPPLREPLCGEQGRARPPSGSGAAGDSRVYVFR